MLEEKNIQSKKYQLGQFFTPVDMVKEILAQITVDADIIVEPSFGGCGFIEPMIDAYPKSKIVGIELDTEWYDLGVQRFPKLDLYNKNFYDIDDELKFTDTKKVTFIGNVPYRTPAYSLTTHRDYVKKLSHKYGVTGIREEAVFFMIKTADIMITNGYTGGVHYIIPKSLITNDSKFYTQFKHFLKKYFTITSVFNVDPAKFDNVAQGLIVLSMETGGNSSNYLVKHNGADEPVDQVIQLTSPDIPFQNIFKKTYLGSVPAESFLLSCSNETATEFKDRLVRIFNNPTTVESLRTDLRHNGQFHLKILNNIDTAKVDVKLAQIAGYINDIKANVKDLGIFSDIANYVPIQQRKETRFYFRHRALRAQGFVYELNPNPQPSFYFTSNPSNGSTDYFGYCEYDINRNSSPGCCRTVPLYNMEDNLTDDFKTYWAKETNGLPLKYVYAYIKHVSSTQWYKDQKRIRCRFYFCIPTVFMSDWLADFTKEKQATEDSIMNDLLANYTPLVLEINEVVDTTNNFSSIFEVV